MVTCCPSLKSYSTIIPLYCSERHGGAKEIESDADYCFYCCSVPHTPHDPRVNVLLCFPTWTPARQPSPLTCPPGITPFNTLVANITFPIIPRAPYVICAAMWWPLRHLHGHVVALTSSVRPCGGPYVICTAMWWPLVICTAMWWPLRHLCGHVVALTSSVRPCGGPYVICAAMWLPLRHLRGHVVALTSSARPCGGPYVICAAMWWPHSIILYIYIYN